MMTIEELKASGSIIFECISGSKAYGLDLPESDTDIKGVFILPQEKLYGLGYTPQVNDESNDVVYYELGRFIELLGKSNPNILEMLAVAEQDVLYKHPVWEMLLSVQVLSKACKNSFAGYATTQIRKAKGLNKKIFNPVAKERKLVLDFCYVLEGQKGVELKEWLKEKQFDQANCGLSKVTHVKGVYALHYQEDSSYQGVIRSDLANEVCLSSIPKEESSISHLYFNQEAYSSYYKEYKAYWEWVEKRNDSRYQNTLDHGKNYDAKNMMHTFRLLNMALEILGEGKIIVKRPDREELLKIRKGDFTYEELIEKAEQKLEAIQEAERRSVLPNSPDKNGMEDILVQMRREYYS